MLKQKLNEIKTTFKRAPLVGLVVAIILGSTGGIVRADQFDQKIQALNNINATNQQSIYNLQIRANSYQDSINKLQGQIDEVSAQIAKTKADQAVVKSKIVAATNQLNKQKKILGDAIQAIYLAGQSSTLEVLLSSDTLSSFVNQEQYHLTVESNIKALVDQITALKAKLNDQNKQLTALLGQQKNQESTLAQSRDQKNQLLGLNQQQQSEFSQRVAANNAEIARLQAEKQAYYAAATNGGSNNFGSLGGLQFRGLSSEQYCGGGYDFCWAGFDQFVSDSWGLHLARECVHYAADRAASGRDLSQYLAGRGNASQWPSSLSGAPGVTVDRNPSVGSVAISIPVNHAMYVEYNAGGGWWGVSQMNFDGMGHYSTMEVNQSSLWFIHFN